MQLCFPWCSADVTWKNAGWRWSQCQTIQDTCVVWGTTGIFFSRANWQWSKCSGSVVPPTPPVTESVVNYGGVDAQVLIQPWVIEPWNPYRAADKEQEEKRKQRIKLILKLKGQEYSMEQYRKNARVTVGHIKMGVETDHRVELETSNEMWSSYV